jgi:hypothetical protein
MRRAYTASVRRWNALKTLARLASCVGALLAAHTSFAGPQVSDEIALDPPASTPGPGSVYYEAAALGAGVWLLTWLDYRDGGPALYAARVAATGALLDPGGIRLAGSTAGGWNTVGDVAVVFDGTDFVVAWSDTRADPTGADLYAARITPDGRDLDPGGAPLIARPDAQRSPALASNGTQLLVSWMDTSTDSNRAIHSSVWAQLVDPASLVTVGPAVAVAATADNTSGPHTVWNGASWAVAFRSWPVASFEPTTVTIDVARIDVTGALLDPVPRVISSAATLDFNPPGMELASDGQVTVVAYVENASGVDARLLAARLGRDGMPLTPSPVEVVHSGVASPRLLGIGVASGTFEVAWSNTDASTYGADGGLVADVPAAATVQYLGSDGSVPTPGSFPLPTSSGVPDVEDVVFAPQALLEMRASQGGATETFQRYSLTGSALDPMPAVLNVASNTQLAPHAAWNGHRYYVSWLDGRAGPGTQRAYGTIVDPDGSVPSPAATALASTPSNQTQLVLAGGASTFLAIWNDDRTGMPAPILATRIDDTGSLLDPAGINATPAFYGPDASSFSATPTSVVFDGTRFLAGYGVGVQDGSGEGVFSIGLDGAVGSLSLPSVAIGAMTPWGSPNVQVGSTGTGSLVEWDWGWQTPSVFVVGPLGGDTNATVPVRPSFDGRSGYAATVDSMASDGTDYLLAFADYPNLSSPGELWLWRFDASGAPATMPTRVATGIGSAKVVFDGSDYLVVWDRWNADGQGDVVGLRVGRDGSPLTTDPFIIAGSPDTETQPSVASDGAGHALVAYARFDSAATFGSMRARARIVDLASPLTDAGASKAAPQAGASVGGGCSMAPADGISEALIPCIAALVLLRRKRVAA